MGPRTMRACNGAGMGPMQGDPQRSRLVGVPSVQLAERPGRESVAPRLLEAVKTPCRGP